MRRRPRPEHRGLEREQRVQHAGVSASTSATRCQRTRRARLPVRCSARVRRKTVELVVSLEPAEVRPASESRGVTRMRRRGEQEQHDGRGARARRRRAWRSESPHDVVRFVDDDEIPGRQRQRVEDVRLASDSRASAIQMPARCPRVVAEAPTCAISRSSRRRVGHPRRRCRTASRSSSRPLLAQRRRHDDEHAGASARRRTSSAMTRPAWIVLPSPTSSAISTRRAPCRIASAGSS